MPRKNTFCEPRDDECSRRSVLSAGFVTLTALAGCTYGGSNQNEGTSDNGGGGNSQNGESGGTKTTQQSTNGANIEIVNAQSLALKEGFSEPADGDLLDTTDKEKAFQRLVLTVKNTGGEDFKATLPKEQYGDRCLPLSGVPTRVTSREEYRVREHGQTERWTLPAGQQEDILIGDDTTGAVGHLAFIGNPEDGISGIESNQEFNSSNQDFPDDYAQGQTHTAKFIFVEATSVRNQMMQSHQIHTPSIALKYSGGLVKQAAMGGENSIYVAKEVQSADG